jgi:mRNA-degrading endonuclease RelE of RelBE toxin-antitoxin system
MRWKVVVSKKAAKRALKTPKHVQVLFQTLLVDLATTGPNQYEWPNYSKLAPHRYHCHLNYSYVAVWEEKDGQLNIIEVTYVGSREDAPY